jgi:hypothetical protein
MANNRSTSSVQPPSFERAWSEFETAIHVEAMARRAASEHNRMANRLFREAS